MTKKSITLPDAIGVTDDFGERVFVPGVVDLVPAVIPAAPDVTARTLPPHRELEKLTDAARLIARAIHPPAENEQADYGNFALRILAEREWIDTLLKMVKDGKLIAVGPYTRLPIDSTDLRQLRETGVINMRHVEEHLKFSGISLNLIGEPGTANDAGQSRTTDEQAPTPLSTATGAVDTKPLARQAFQENEILRVLAELGYQATALPRSSAGQPSVKAAIRRKLDKFTDPIFKKAWQRCLDSKAIAWRE
jgi:hypothetical protein